jgi:hypothetical protein
MNARTATVYFAALFFAVMLFNARRFVEYFPPFALIFAAFAWSGVFDFERELTPEFSSKLRTFAPAIVLAIAILAGVVKSFPVVQNQLAKSKPYDLYADSSAWLAKNTEAGELIFQTDWDDFPRLFFYNTHNAYLAGLDPTYLQIYDPALYEEWVSITRGDVQNPSELIHTHFNARYVHSDLNHGDFIEQAENDPGMHEVYRDDNSVLFEVLQP